MWLSSRSDELDIFCSILFDTSPVDHPQILNVKRNLIENLAIQSNIPLHRARLAGNLSDVSDYSLTVDDMVVCIADYRFQIFIHCSHG